MPTRVLSIPFILVAAALLYLTWEVSETYALWLPAPIIVLAAIYTLSPQINWWWYKRHTPELEEPLRQLLSRHHIFYPRLSAENKLRFRQRVVLFRMGQDFMPQGWDSVPDDVQGILAIHAVSLTIGWEKYLVYPYENVVVYPHPFPSLQFPHHFHSSELFEEDSVLLFSAEPLMKSLLQPASEFNVAMYEYARVLMRVHGNLAWPETDESWWDSLHGACGYGRSAVAKAINLPEEAIELLPVAIVAFFVFPQPLGLGMPGLCADLARVFAFDPKSGQRVTADQ